MNNNTYRDIIHSFKDFCHRHSMINEVVDDRTWNFQSMENLYPAVIIVPSTTTGDSGSVKVGFNIFFCDILQDSAFNTRDVYSDMLEVAKDFVSYFTEPDNDWSIDSDFTLNPFEEKFDDRVGGWELDCTVSVPFSHSVCDIPLEDNVPVTTPPEAYFTYSVMGDEVIFHNLSRFYDDCSWEMPGSKEETFWYISPEKIRVKFNTGTWLITLRVKREGFPDSTYSQMIHIN